MYLNSICFNHVFSLNGRKSKALKKLQDELDANSEKMPENCYLELCKGTKRLFDQTNSLVEENKRLKKPN